VECSCHVHINKLATWLDMSNPSTARNVHGPFPDFLMQPMRSNGQASNSRLKIRGLFSLSCRSRFFHLFSRFSP
jgi:hypothetical protein